MSARSLCPLARCCLAISCSRVNTRWIWRPDNVGVKPSNEGGGVNHVHTFFWYCFSLSLWSFILGFVSQLKQTQGLGAQTYSRIARSRGVIFGTDWFPPMTKSRTTSPLGDSGTMMKLDGESESIETRINSSVFATVSLGTRTLNSRSDSSLLFCGKCAHGCSKPQLSPRPEYPAATKSRCGG